MKIKNILLLTLALPIFAHSSQSTNKVRLGENFFHGNFSNKSSGLPDQSYTVSSGDTINISLTGLVNSSEEYTVDSLGNIYLEEVGKIHVEGIKNKDLQLYVSKTLSKTYKEGVDVYCYISSYKPITVNVLGRVIHPGSYKSFSGTNILDLLDQSGGIREDGSFIDISVIRDGLVISTLNLYDAVLSGDSSFAYLQDGDNIVVNSNHGSIDVSKGEKIESIEVQKNISWEKFNKYIYTPSKYNMLKVTSVKDGNIDSAKYNLSDSHPEYLNDGDFLEFYENVKNSTITVTVDGEHKGDSVSIEERDATLQSLIEKVDTYSSSDLDNILLFRQSEKERQKQSLIESLNRLEKQISTTQSVSVDTAEIQDKESKNILDWIAKAKLVEPTGQIILPKTSYDKVLLEDGDRVFIPRKTDLISISGEIFSPRTMIQRSGLSVEDYIDLCGGFSESANTDKVIVVSPNGLIKELSDSFGSGSISGFKPKAGDTILVLPTVNTKNIQLTKDITKILYQIAVSTSVVLSL